MIKNVLSDIKTALKRGFPSYKIYDEYVRQGFVRPCFFVALTKSTMKKELGNRYFVTLSWKISCYEPTSYLGEYHSTEVYHQRSLALYDLLETEGYQLLEMRHKIVDDVLYFYLTQGFYCEKIPQTETKEKMMNLNLEME